MCTTPSRCAQDGHEILVDESDPQRAARDAELARVVEQRALESRAAEQLKTGDTLAAEFAKSMRPAGPGGVDETAGV